VIQCHLFGFEAYLINLMATRFGIRRNICVKRNFIKVYFPQLKLNFILPICFIFNSTRYLVKFVCIYFHLTQFLPYLLKSVRIIPILKFFIINNQQISAFINYHETRYFSLVILSMKWIKCNLSTSTAVSVTIWRKTQLSCRKTLCVSLFFKWDKN